MTYLVFPSFATAQVEAPHLPSGARVLNQTKSGTLIEVTGAENIDQLLRLQNISKSASAPGCDSNFLACRFVILQDGRFIPMFSYPHPPKELEPPASGF